MAYDFKWIQHEDHTSLRKTTHQRRYIKSDTTLTDFISFIFLLLQIYFGFYIFGYPILILTQQPWIPTHTSY